MHPIFQNISRSYATKVLMLIFFSFSLQAQLISPLEDRASCNFSDIEEDRLDNMLTNDAVESFSLVTVNDPFEMTSSGRLSFSIPDIEANYTALAVNREYEDSDNYTWSGNLVGQEGHIVLVAKNGYVGGVIQIADEAFYSIAPISVGKSALLKADQSNFVPSASDVAENNDSQEDDFDVCTTDNETCYDNPQEITVMVLIPDEVSEYLGGNTLAAAIYVGIGIEATNVALANSGITNVNINWFTERIDFEFDQSVDIREDQEKLIADTTIANIRQQKKADLVVLFSNQNYTVIQDTTVVPVYGSAGFIGKNKARAYAIVEISQILGPRYTFAHEIGHLLGARHEDDPVDDCCHAAIIDNGPFSTLMYVGIGTRSLVFSDKAPRNNNTLCIKNTVCEVADYFATDFTAYIRPNQACHKEGQDNTFTAIATAQSSNQSPFEYVWTYKMGRMRDTFGTERTSDPLPADVIDLENSPVSIEVEVTSVPTGVSKRFTYESKHCDDPCEIICPNLTASFTTENLPNCPNGTNGSLTITPEGGTAPYTYAWSSNDNTATVDNLVAGTYTVTVTDANNCSGVFSYDLQGASPLDLRPNIRDTDCGASNGNIRLRPQGAPGPYSYQWSNNSTSKNQFGLSEGNYSVTVTDGNGCIVIGDYEVKQRNAPELDLDITDTNCNEDNGAIDLTITGGTAPYTIQWDNDCGPEDEEDIFDLAAGTYSVTVTDDRGCVVTASGVVAKSSRIRIVARTTEAAVGQSDANIDLSVKGGTPPYDYDWDTDGTGDFDDPEDLTDLAAGTYTVVVRDATGCTQEEVVTIRNPKSNDFFLETEVTDASCGANNGAIDLTITGGTEPYTIDWDNDGTGDNDDPEDLTDLAAGDYNVTVTDANGEITSTGVTVGTTGGLDLSTTTTDASCGIDNGTIDLTITGGQTPYTIDWNNDGTGDNDDPEDLTDLAAGDYEVTVTDANGCSSSTTASVGSSSGLSLSTITTDASCGADNGTIDLTIAGGQAPYTIDWDNDGTGDNDDPEDLTDLAAGNYNVTVTDANNCSASATATIASSGGLSLSTSVTDASCGANNGSIDLTIAGGQAPYTIDWDNDGTGDNDDPEDLSDLAAGNYNVTVSDANGCSASAAATIEASGGLAITPTLTPPSACNITDGSISIAIAGGASPYQIDWLNAEGDDNLSIVSGLLPGIYEVIVTDANGCSTMEAFELTHPSSNLRGTFGAIGTDCMGNGGGLIFNAIGGTPPYTYFWKIKSAGPPWPSFGPTFNTSHTATNIPQGLYDLFIADANGCTYASGVEIGYADDLLKIQQVNPMLPACGASDGSLEVVTIQGTPPMTYELTNNANINQTISSSADAHTFTSLPADTYEITVTDSDGCVRSMTFNLVDDSDLAISLFPTNAICENNDGSVNLVITGGIEPYQIDWGHLAGNNNMEDLPMVTAGTYEVTVTDADNCSREGSVEVDATDNLQANFYDRTANCNGVGGGIDFEVVSGTPPYTYSWRLRPSGAWQSSIPTSDATYSVSLSAGTYDVEVRDANGCEEFQTVTVEQQSGPSISYGAVDHNCSSGGGTINTNVSGSGNINMPTKS